MRISPCTSMWRSNCSRCRPVCARPGRGPAAEPHVGTRLWRDAAQHGSQAIGQPAGAIDVGRRADWLVLDAAHPSLAGAAADTALDHLLFAGGEAAIRDVAVAGRWVIQNRRHALEDELRPRFAGLMRRLAAVEWTHR